MEKKILEELTSIFKEVFGEDNIQLERSTTAADIEQWDSLTNIEMIVAVEKYFAIKFKSMDLRKLHNVGDLADLIKDKMSN